MVERPGPAKGRQARHSERSEQRKQIIARTIVLHYQKPLTNDKIL